VVGVRIMFRLLSMEDGAEGFIRMGLNG